MAEFAHGITATNALLWFRSEEALVQNELANIFQDDFAALAEEDGMSGNRRENTIQEHQSFTDLLYSKNKVRGSVDCCSTYVQSCKQLA
jgi:hypothetical protein